MIKKIEMGFEKQILHILPKIMIQFNHSRLSLIYKNLQIAAETLLKAVTSLKQINQKT